MIRLGKLIATMNRNRSQAKASDIRLKKKKLLEKRIPGQLFYVCVFLRSVQMFATITQFIIY